MKNPKKVLWALLTVQVLFALNNVVTKYIVEIFPPLLWGSFRIFVAALLLLVVAYFTRKKHFPAPRDRGDFFRMLILLSLWGTIINQSSFLVGLSYTTATNSAIINTLIPVFTLMIVTLKGDEPPSLHRVMGILVAFCGVLVLRKAENFRLSDETFIGDMLMLVNCISYACFLAFSKKFMMRFDRLWATAWLFSYGSIGIGILAFPDWQTFTMPALSNTLIACCVFAVFCGTLVTYFLNNWALAYADPTHVALGIYIQPVIVAAIASSWFGETITVRTVASSVLIFLGLLLAISKRRKKHA